MFIVKRRSELLRFGLFLLLMGLLAYFVADHIGESWPFLQKAPPRQLPASTPTAAASLDVADGGDFFADFRMGRQRRIGALRESMKEVMESEGVDAETKRQASQQYMESGRLAALEDRAEAMVRARGFEDAIVTLAGGNAQVIIKADHLTQQQFMQVLDIVSQTTGVRTGAVQVWNRRQ